MKLACCDNTRREWLGLHTSSDGTGPGRSRVSTSDESGELVRQEIEPTGNGAGTSSESREAGFRTGTPEVSLG